MTHSFIFEFIKYSKTVINYPYKPMNAKNQPNKKKVCKEKQFYENTGGPDSEIGFQYLAVLVPTASRPGSQNQSP